MNFIRIRSDTLLNVAMDVLNSREVRKLELVDHSQDFRHLKSFLKNKMVMVRAGPKSYKKKIRDLVAYAGKYSFDKEGMQTTVAVRRHKKSDGTPTDLATVSRSIIVRRTKSS